MQSLTNLENPARCPSHRRRSAPRWEDKHERDRVEVNNSGLQPPCFNPADATPERSSQVVQGFVLAFFHWGVPGVELDLPQFDLLVPRAPAVLPELVGRLWVNARLTHVSGDRREKQGCFFCLVTLPTRGITNKNN